MARDDSDGQAAELQRKLWLADALDRLPLAIGLIDASGKYIALSGAMRHLLGVIIPSRNSDLKRRWQVFDDNGNLVDPSNWPSERTLRGDGVMTGLNGVYMPGSELDRRMRLFSTPFVDATGQSCGLVMMYDNEIELAARGVPFGAIQQRFVDTLIDTIRKAAAQVDGDPQLAHATIAKAMGFNQNPPVDPPGDLSPRETEVLKLMAWGNSRKDISAQLGITVKTVEFHRSSAAKKLDLKSRADVMRYAVGQGWLER